MRILFVLSIFIGWLIGSILDEFLMKESTFAVVFAVIAPAYILYRQVEADLAKLKRDKSEAEKEEDSQLLFEEALQHCGKLFSSRIYDEEFVDSLISLSAYSLLLEDENAVEIAKLLRSLACHENFEKMTAKDANYIADWVKQYMHKHLHSDKEVQSLRIYIENDILNKSGE